MKRTPYITIILLFLLCHTGMLSAAPVGNIYDPIQWAISPFNYGTPLSLIIRVEKDNQVNRLPEQIRRFPWADPNSLPLEERHYPQTRWSRNELSILGVRIGKPVTSNAIVYAILGMSQATIDFHYEDWTVSRYYASNDTFKSGYDLYYGLGATILMHEGEIKNKLPYALGMDIQYRRFTAEEDNILKNGTSYDCSLDEVQLAFSMSIRAERFSPYAGFKVASITGHERYTNTKYKTAYYDAGYIQYDDDITWSEDIGYFIGVTTTIMDRCSVGFEWRDGDEKGMGINVTAKF